MIHILQAAANAVDRTHPISLTTLIPAGPLDCKNLRAFYLAYPPLSKVRDLRRRYPSERFSAGQHSVILWNPPGAPRSCPSLPTQTDHRLHRPREILVLMVEQAKAPGKSHLVHPELTHTARIKRRPDQRQGQHRYSQPLCHSADQRLGADALDRKSVV